MSITPTTPSSLGKKTQDICTMSGQQKKAKQGQTSAPCQDSRKRQIKDRQLHHIRTTEKDKSNIDLDIYVHVPVVIVESDWSEPGLVSWSSSSSISDCFRKGTLLFLPSSFWSVAMVIWTS